MVDYKNKPGWAHNTTTGLFNRNEPISTSVVGTIFVRHGYSTARNYFRPQERSLR